MDAREPAVAKLLGKLEDASYSDHILLGHQNAGHIGVSLDNTDGSRSDIKNLLGKHPAVVGIDTLSFNGYEGTMLELVKTVKQLHKEGVILTLSSHMPNFSLGGEEFFDYSPNIPDGNVGERLLPGGDLNAKYMRFLDDIALFASKCVDISGERIPMIFRPFHECNGSWFWWGKEHLSDEKFIDLFRFTVDYLMNKKKIRNFLFCYSPNGFFKSADDFLSRYPGDDFVDIMGMDIYHDRPSEGDGFFDELISSLEVMASCAQDHGKIYAITEIGLRTLDQNPDGFYEGLAPKGNLQREWFTDLLDALKDSEEGLRVAYMLFWANFSDTQFWVPYEKGDFRHEMCDNFIEFATSKYIKLAP